ncbi:carboxylesterase [Vararia minispora EC-137]|uniref:Carboxylesterase n=1 Tax=Vararia minispora EC-137 TaxID=1314806 RepID=A0ACB8QMP2_9AGAM|nr:carboxylesterase [Vararia minispora EC-137]
MANTHLDEELMTSADKVEIQTRYGPVKGRRARNGAACFLEIPFSAPVGRWKDPQPLPDDYRYEDKEYIRESKYAAQPANNGQAVGVPIKDVLGNGEPSEDPLFVNVVVPPSFPSEAKFPVKVYIHGGFLQFGSPHGLSGQHQYASEARNQIFVNIGYRLSVFGFLASAKVGLDGNYGFKDQWLALEWVKANISAFGGDPDDIEVSGLSAGAHSVHQLLHYASHLPHGVLAPFTSAVLQSNAISTDPKPLAELDEQFDAFVMALGLDPSAPDILSTLRDPKHVPWRRLTDLIDSEALGAHGTFRGAADGHWMSAEPGAMAWQRSGGLARGLAAHGVRSVVLGDLTEEWYLYAIAHPVETVADVKTNLLRYYPADVVEKLMDIYAGEGRIKERMTKEEVFRLFGDILSQGQVHLPVRLLHRDLLAAGFPVARYEIQWTPEQVRPLGYVTHATDRALWAFRKPILKPDQVHVAREWLDAVDKEIKRLKAGEKPKALKDILVLKVDKTVVWTEDVRWDRWITARTALPGED